MTQRIYQLGVGHQLRRPWHAAAWCDARPTAAATIPPMAKRARGSRPGQRGRLIRPSGRPAPSATTPPAQPVGQPVAAGGLTDAEEARAAAIEAQIVAEERAAETARQRGGRRPATERDDTIRSRGRESGMLAVRTADEVVVVRRDLHRIALIDGGLVAILFGLWILGSLTGVIHV
jgi:hypothetical protein